MGRIVSAHSGVAQSAVEATVIRCRCGNPASHRNAVCPNGVAEQHGTIAFYHRDWRIRLIYWLLSRTGYKFNLWVGKRGE